MKTQTKTKKAIATTTSTPTAAAPPAAPVATPVATTTTGTAPAPSTAQAQPSGSPGTVITNVANRNNKGTKVDLQTAFSALSSGLLAVYEPTDVFALSTGNETCEQLVGQFQQFIQAAETTKSAFVAYRAAVQAERALALQVLPLRSGVHHILIARFGRGGSDMLKFGYTPYVAKAATPAAKAAAVVKRKATREARGTKGTVQREAIQGNVVGVEMTPVTMTLSTSAPSTTTAAAAAVPVTK